MDYATLELRILAAAQNLAGDGRKSSSSTSSPAELRENERAARRRALGLLPRRGAHGRSARRVAAPPTPAPAPAPAPLPFPWPIPYWEFPEEQEEEPIWC